MEGKKQKTENNLVTINNKRADEVSKAQERDTYLARWSDKNSKTSRGYGVEEA